jgi:hypothetical protein
LVEVMVRGQGVLNRVPGHEEKTNGIAQGPILVRALLQLRQGGPVQRLAHVDHLHGAVVLEIGHERQGGLAGKPSGFGQGHEFREDVIMGQAESGRPKKLYGRGMLRLRAMVETQEP